MKTRTKMKKYTALSVSLNVKRELAAPNGGRQFTICINAPTKKRVAEILGIPLHDLNNFSGLMVNESYSFTPPTDEEIYFHNENSNTPHRGEWLSYKEWKRDL
jgi:hypothetical protein